MSNSFKTHRLVVSALMIALSTVLSFIILFRFPFGGSITLCSMLPLILLAYRYGPKWGLASCFAYSLIQTMQGVAEGTFTAASMGVENGVYAGGFFVGSPLLATFFIILLDYVLAFTLIGTVGIFRNRFQAKPAMGIVIGTLFAGALRYICHVVSGAIFFGIWGEWFFTQSTFFSWGQTLVEMFPGKSLYLIYSLIYNGFFLLPEITITAVIGFIAVKTAPKLLGSKADYPQNGQYQN